MAIPSSILALRIIFLVLLSIFVTIGNGQYYRTVSVPARVGTMPHSRVIVSRPGYRVVPNYHRIGPLINNIPEDPSSAVPIPPILTPFRDLFRMASQPGGLLNVFGLPVHPMGGLFNPLNTIPTRPMEYEAALQPPTRWHEASTPASSPYMNHVALSNDRDEHLSRRGPSNNQPQPSSSVNMMTPSTSSGLQATTAAPIDTAQNNRTSTAVHDSDLGFE